MSEQTGWPPGARAATALLGLLVEPGRRRGQGRVLAVVDTPLLLGRDDDCDVVFLGEQVSRRHARVWAFAEGHYAVEDLRSLNGTFVNGRRVAGACELADGDRLMLADVELCFRVRAAGSVPSLPRRPQAAQGGTPRPPTAPMPPPATYALVQAPARRPAGSQLLGVVLGVIASVAGATVGYAAGAGRPGAIALAVLAPLVVVAALLRTLATVALVTLLSVVLTVGGVSAAEVTLGRPVLPGVSADGTFLAAARTACARPSLALSPGQGPLSAPVRVSGGCLRAGEAARVTLGAAVLATLTADAHGQVAGVVRLPREGCVAAGCPLVLTGAASGPSAASLYLATR